MQEKLLPTHLPWQLSRWSQLCELVERKQLPQSLLLSGPEAIGKQRFAEAFVAYLLCRSPSALAACGKCQSCNYLLAGSHPDYQMVAPLEGKRQIAVDQLRAVKAFAEQSAHYEGGRKVIVIQPAEAMNHFAANALLKTLEEPTPNTYLILLSHAGAKLLPTIRSRCIKYTFAVPEIESATKWLGNYITDTHERDQLLVEAGGRPLLARQLHEQDGLGLRRQLDAGVQQLAEGKLSPLALAETYQEHDTQLFLEWWALRLLALSKYQLAGRPLDHAEWQPFSKIPHDVILETLREALTLKADLQRGANLNKKLLTEDILLSWHQKLQSCAKR